MLVAPIQSDGVTLLHYNACSLPQQVGWADVSKMRTITNKPATDSPISAANSPFLFVPPSRTSSRGLPNSLREGGEPTLPPLAEGATGDRGEETAALADAEAGVEEILPLEARRALLDYKPGDVVVAATERGWHLVKAGPGGCTLKCSG